MTAVKKNYNSKDEWYTPEIDYFEMLEKFQWTRDSMAGMIRGILPTKHLSLMDYAGMWRSDGSRDQQMFQFWNKQFNDEIVKVINLITKLEKPKLILDVCAGDGTLAKILSERGFIVKAVDNYEWPFKKRYFNVEKMDFRDALKKYHPDFVIGCWMPLGTNWTYSFRRIKSVKNYMIIGEGDGGCTGGEWIERKGWNLRYHDDASRYGLCRTDSVFFENNGEMSAFGLRHTQVYSFSRYEKIEEKA